MSTFIQFTATELPPPPPYSVYGSSIETYDPTTSVIYEKLDPISQIDYPYPPAIEFAEKKLRIASTEDPSPWEDKVAELEDIIDSLQSELDGTRQFMDDLQQRLDVCVSIVQTGALVRIVMDRFYSPSDPYRNPYLFHFKQPRKHKQGHDQRPQRYCRQRVRSIVQSNFPTQHKLGFYSLSN